MVGNGIISGRIFSDPKNRRNDGVFPRVAAFPLPPRIGELGRCRTDRVDTEEKVVTQAVLLFAQFDLRGDALGRRRRRKQGRDRGKNNGNGVCDRSWFHRKQSSAI